MEKVRKHRLDLSGKTNTFVAFLAALLTVAVIAFSAYESNATDQEVKDAVDAAKIESKQELAKFMAQVLKNLEVLETNMKALEVRIVNGDNMILMEFVLAEINRLELQLRVGPPNERSVLEGKLAKRRTQLDTLMDSIRIGPVVADQSSVGIP